MQCTEDGLGLSAAAPEVEWLESHAIQSTTEPRRNRSATTKKLSRASFPRSGTADTAVLPTTADTPAVPPLRRLPQLHEHDEHHHVAEHDAPLPRQPEVLEHLRVEHGDVYDGEGDDETEDDRPEEELVLVHGLEHRRRAGPAIVHGEHALVGVLDLEREDEQKESERGERRAARAVHEVAARRTLVAAGREVLEPARGRGVGDDHEGLEGQDALEDAVDELVDDEVAREDAGFRVAGRALQDVGLGLFEAEAERKRGRGDEVGPEDFQGGEREDGGSVGVLERETAEQEHDLGQVGGQEMEEELRLISKGSVMPHGMFSPFRYCH